MTHLFFPPLGFLLCFKEARTASSNTVFMLVPALAEHSIAPAAPIEDARASISSLVTSFFGISDLVPTISFGQPSVYLLLSSNHCT